jgi:hypothetical protein
MRQSGVENHDCEQPAGISRNKNPKFAVDFSSFDHQGLARSEGDLRNARLL